ncbi:MAG: putative Mg2+ transporter-C (MgtC) family protein [Bacteroidia bacterium]|jgi:putative Mg2+ transporter-C (MgtC) family protein
MEYLSDFFQQIGPTITELDYTPLLLALICGGAIGFERELSGRAAGLRTHILVCLSSTLLILTSRGIADAGINLPEAARVVFDPNRMGAGIVTGIGFLGAATVLRSGDMLRGLTTAACIWFVAGLGIVIGTGQYGFAIVGTLMVLFVLTVVNRLVGLVKPVVYRRLIVITTSSEIEPQVASVSAALNRHKMRIIDIASGHSNETGRHELIFYISLKNSFQAPRLTEEVGAMADVLSARWKQIDG